ncbi:MAG TPA: AAA family ATPase [Microlunatus sp.]
MSAVSATPNARLTTLVGLGGSGKTRLAVEVTTRLLDEQRGRARFPDGVWWVDLAMVTDPARVPQTLAAAAGLEGLARHSSVDTLARALRSRRALVVVDNCEHLLPACEALGRRRVRQLPRVDGAGHQPDPAQRWAGGHRRGTGQSDGSPDLAEPRRLPVTTGRASSCRATPRPLTTRPP